MFPMLANLAMLPVFAMPAVLLFLFFFTISAIPPMLSMSPFFPMFSPSPTFAIFLMPSITPMVAMILLLAMSNLLCYATKSTWNAKK